MKIDERHAQPIPDVLSISPDKRQLYAVDTYFNETWEDVQRELPDQLQPMDRIATLVLKPDAFAGRAAEASLNWLASHGYDVLHSRKFRFNRFSIRGIWEYQWNIATRARKDVVDDLLQAGDSVYLVLRNGNSACASRELASMKGSSAPSKRKPGDFRFDISGPNTLLNFIHTSDEPADIIREMGVFFNADERREILSSIREDVVQFSEAQELLQNVERSYGDVVDLDFGRVVRGLRDQLGSGSTAAQSTLASTLAEVQSGGTIPWPVLDLQLREAGLGIPRWDRIILSTTLVNMDTPEGEPVVNGLSTSPRTEFPAFT